MHRRKTEIAHKSHKPPKKVIFADVLIIDLDVDRHLVSDDELQTHTDNNDDDVSQQTLSFISPSISAMYFVQTNEIMIGW